MRMFAADSPDATSARTAVPVEILRRLAFGRPQRRLVPPTLPVVPPVDAAAATQREDVADLDQRVRQSGEW